MAVNKAAREWLEKHDKHRLGYVGDGLAGFVGFHCLKCGVTHQQDLRALQDDSLVYSVLRHLNPPSLWEHLDATD